MSPGRSKEEQRSMWLSSDQLSQSQGHAFYERLQQLLRREGFDGHVENLSAPFYAEEPGRKSIPPGRYFRMLLTGDENNSKASILSAASADAARDSLSLREFIGLAPGESVPGHFSLCRIRQRLPPETVVHSADQGGTTINWHHV